MLLEKPARRRPKSTNLSPRSEEEVVIRWLSGSIDLGVLVLLLRFDVANALTVVRETRSRNPALPSTAAAGV
jgi:hypothetical protein